MIEAKEITNDMGIEAIFPKKRVIKRKRHFDENVNDEIQLSQEESFRVDYFIYIVDRALSSLKNRFEQFQEYEGTFGFLFDLEKLKSMVDDTLNASCDKLDDIFKNDTTSDID